MAVRVNIMLPSIRLVIAAIVATVVLTMGGFGLVATFQIAKTSIGAPPRGASPRDPALTVRPERNKVHASTGTPRLNEGASVVDMPSAHRAAVSTANSSPAARSDNEDAVVGTRTNSGAASPPELVSPSGSRDAGPDEISGVDARPERAPAVVALTEDAAPAIENPSARAAAETAPIASSEGQPVGTAVPVEAPTIDVDNASASSIAPAAILSTPDVAVAAAPPSPGHEAMDASPSRTVPEVGSSRTPAEAASPSGTAGETTAAGSRSPADEIGTAPTPLGAIEAVIAPNPKSPKAIATKGKRATKTTKPHSQAKNAKAHQATTSKAKVWVAAHVRRRSVRPDRQSTSQPQNPANPFGNFFGSQQVGGWPSAIGAAR
jgi:hypothetical protein